MSTIWGYARVSTPKQKLERQVENIRQAFPDAVIIEEAYTGATTDRPKWNGLMRKLACGDTVVFDEVSRMSRNAEEGMALYERLYDQGIHLVYHRLEYPVEEAANKIFQTPELNNFLGDRLQAGR